MSTQSPARSRSESRSPARSRSGSSDKKSRKSPTKTRDSKSPKRRESRSPRRDSKSPKRRDSRSPRRSRSNDRRSRSNSRSRSRTPDNTVKLFLGNLPYDTRESELKALFDPFGEIDKVQLITKEYPRSFNYCFYIIIIIVNSVIYFEFRITDTF
jgi:RNA recognition motif-containing protein